MERFRRNALIINSNTLVRSHIGPRACSGPENPVMSEQDRPSRVDTTVPEVFDDLFQRADATGEPIDAPDDQPSHEDWLSTGIDALDRYLDGGIPPGRLVSFVTPADTQGELVVKQIASQHDCLYLTSLRSEWEVQETVRDYIQPFGSVDSDRVDFRVRNLDPDARLEAAENHLDTIDEESMVVIDSVNELEDDFASPYVEFLHNFKELLWDSGSVGILNCIEDGTIPPDREVTFRLSDIIWRLRRSVDTGRIEYLLDVSKFRGGRALTEPIKLELTDEIEIDTSRDIA